MEWSGWFRHIAAGKFTTTLAQPRGPHSADLNHHTVLPHTGPTKAFVKQERMFLSNRHVFTHNKKTYECDAQSSQLETWKMANKENNQYPNYASATDDQPIPNHTRDCYWNRGCFHQFPDKVLLPKWPYGQWDHFMVSTSKLIYLEKRYQKKQGGFTTFSDTL